MWPDRAVDPARVVSWARCSSPRSAPIPGRTRSPSSRFGELPGELVDYTPTEPLLVVEVDAAVWEVSDGLCKT
jgi:hypothetical protein